MSIHEVLTAMIGQQIPGGCDTCDAYQTMSMQDGIYLMHVHHDDWCPTYQAMTTRRHRGDSGRQSGSK